MPQSLADKQRLDRPVFVVGETARLTVEFSDQGTLTSPTTVRLLIKPPRNAAARRITMSDIVEVSEGRFYYDIVLDDDGDWNWRWEGTEGIIAVAQGHQWVDAANVEYP